MACRRSCILDIIRQAGGATELLVVSRHRQNGANRVTIMGGSGYAGQVHDGGYPGSETASWDGAWCSFEHGGVSTLEQSRRLALHAPWESAGDGISSAGTTERDR